MPWELVHWTVFLKTAIENAQALIRSGVWGGLVCFGFVFSFLIWACLWVWGFFTLTGREVVGQLRCDILDSLETNMWTICDVWSFSLGAGKACILALVLKIPRKKQIHIVYPIIWGPKDNDYKEKFFVKFHREHISKSTESQTISCHPTSK